MEKEDKQKKKEESNSKDNKKEEVTEKKSNIEKIIEIKSKQKITLQKEITPIQLIDFTNSATLNEKNTSQSLNLENEITSTPIESSNENNDSIDYMKNPKDKKNDLYSMDTKTESPENISFNQRQSLNENELGRSVDTLTQATHQSTQGFEDMKHQELEYKPATELNENELGRRDPNQMYLPD